MSLFLSLSRIQFIKIGSIKKYFQKLRFGEKIKGGTPYREVVYKKGAQIFCTLWHLVRAMQTENQVECTFAKQAL